MTKLTHSTADRLARIEAGYDQPSSRDEERLIVPQPEYDPWDWETILNSEFCPK